MNTFLEQARAFFFQQTGDAAGSQQLALQALANLRQQQAASLAYFDVFWVAAVLGVGLVFLVLLMKRSVAEKGARLRRNESIGNVPPATAPAFYGWTN